MRRITAWLVVVFVVVLGSRASSAHAQATAATRPGAGVVTPEQHLGRPVGADFTLADWDEVSGYYRKLADQTPNLRLDVAGKTTEGRDFLVATISSEANLRNLDRLKAHARTIADPRGRTSDEREAALRDGKVFVVITPSMHSTEVGAVQMGMELAHLLATSDAEPWRSAREQVVVFLTPTLNPDGLDHVVDWYRKTVDTPYEGTGLPKLYQLYTGHDNNRDWFMISQAETRILSRLMYGEWFPQVLWDVHQQGSDRERLFVPPYRDPLNPNLDPAIVAGINLVGTRAVLDLTREGFTGVSTGSTYDMWWHGGNRSTPARHNIVGILTEAASANLASPIFLKRDDLRPPAGDQYGPSTQFPNPWPGGWWRVRDIIDYELAFARSLLGTITREPRLWRENALAAADRAVRPDPEGVKGWVIPSDNRDPSAVRRLVDSLLVSGIEVHVSDRELTLDGRTYPAGSIVIRRDQPWGAHVKDLFEVQRYPEQKAPYDVAGWTLPLLMGVHRAEVMQPIGADVATKRIDTAADAMAAFPGDARARGEGTFSSADSASWTRVAELLQGGQAVTFDAAGDDAGLFRAGATAPAAATAPAPASTLPSEITVARLPRIGVYAPWSGNMDEGWLRWVLETWRLPYVSVRNEALRAGRLDAFLDVLIVPHASAASIGSGRAFGSAPEELTGGLSPEGSAAVEEFVRGGGTLLTFGGASKWAIDLLQVPLTDTTVGDAAKGFACPGSVLRGIPDAGHPLTAGLPASVPLMFANGSGWREMSKADREAANLPDKELRPLLRYAPTELLLSGYLARPEVLEGHAAWVRVSHGKGRAHLFAFQPHYRAWTQATFPLIFRAALLDAPVGG